MTSLLACVLILSWHVQRIGQRAMILSGMNAAEVGEIIGAYRDAGKISRTVSLYTVHKATVFCEIDSSAKLEYTVVICIGLPVVVKSCWAPIDSR